MILGVDFTSSALDLVYLLDDSNEAYHERIELPGATAFDRAHHLPLYWPKRGRLEELGVYLVAIEKPMTHSFKSAATLMRVQGAILGRLGPWSDVLELPPEEWKRELGLGGRAQKPAVHAAVVKLYPGAREWSQDAADAYGIAYAARALCERAAAAAAARAR